MFERAKMARQHRPRGGRLSRALERRGTAERAVNDLDEVALLAQDDACRPGPREVGRRVRVGLDAGLEALVGRQALERHDRPGDVIRAFVRKKVADQVAAAAGNDRAPVLRIRLERLSLEGVDLITNDATDHRCPPHEPDGGSLPVGKHRYFVYHHTMDDVPDVGGDVGVAVSAVAAAIGEPARARMLLCLMDGHSRTSTELAIVAGVTPSTASAHLKRLTAAHLVAVFVQGKHRYYRVEGPDVASALEGLSAVATDGREAFVPTAPQRLRAARTCYDHIAGTLGVMLHDRMKALGWLSAPTGRDDNRYDVTAAGAQALEALGLDVEAARARRRRFACACLDWSERRPHLGGALGAALLTLALKRKWDVENPHDRALTVTPQGRRELATRFGVRSEERTRP